MLHLSPDPQQPCCSSSLASLLQPSIPREDTNPEARVYERDKHPHRTRLAPRCSFSVRNSTCPRRKSSTSTCQPCRPQTTGCNQPRGKVDEAHVRETQSLQPRVMEELHIPCTQSDGENLRALETREQRAEGVKIETQPAHNHNDIWEYLRTNSWGKNITLTALRNWLLLLYWVGFFAHRSETGSLKSDQ